MQAMLGTLLDRLQGFLGKAYFLAGFLPMVVFLTLNALLSAAVFPDAAARLQELTRLDAGNLLTWLGLLLLAYLLGLLVWSLNPTIRRFLEGGHLPRRARRHLVRLHERELIALLGQRRQLIVALFDLRQVTQGPDRWAVQLVAARTEGKERRAKDVSSELKVASREIQRRRDRLEVLGLADLRPLFELLKDELAANPADQVRELDQLQLDFMELLEFVHQSAEAAYTELNSELGIRFPKNVAKVGPTRLANQAEVQREYGLRRYGLDIELYWLRLQKIARGDDRFFPLLEDAKTQLDFSVTTVALLTLLTVLWGLLSLLYARTAGLFLALAVLGPLSIWLFSHVVNQSYRAFAEAVRSAVDLYRFDLLRALHLPLPPDSAVEKLLWVGLMERTAGDPAQALGYLHPPDNDDGGQPCQPERAGR